MHTIAPPKPYEGLSITNIAIILRPVYGNYPGLHSGVLATFSDGSIHVIEGNPGTDSTMAVDYTVYRPDNLDAFNTSWLTHSTRCYTLPVGYGTTDLETSWKALVLQFIKNAGEYSVWGVDGHDGSIKYTPENTSSEVIGANFPLGEEMLSYSFLGDNCHAVVTNGLIAGGIPIPNHAHLSLWDWMSTKGLGGHRNPEPHQYTNPYFLDAKGVSPSTSDPLVLDLDGDGFEMVGQNEGITFDHNGNGVAQGTNWVKPDDGFLVFDRNNDGIINNGSELFGEYTTRYDGLPTPASWYSQGLGNSGEAPPPWTAFDALA